MIQNQLSLQDARKLFDYRDGMLFWRHTGSGRRRDGAAITRRGGQSVGDKDYVRIGGVRLLAHYAVWNWHYGITRHSIVPANGDYSDRRIENLREIERIIAHRLPTANSCPCCAQSVPVPSSHVVSINCGLTQMETKILEAVWAGGGRGVQAEKIFVRMYEDDPDGGPMPNKMYLAFKVALCHMREKLQGSGVSIENVGYRQGYRLVIGKPKE